jgi:hypothetical protein
MATHDSQSNSNGQMDLPFLALLRALSMKERQTSEEWVFEIEVDVELLVTCPQLTFGPESPDHGRRTQV